MVWAWWVNQVTSSAAMPRITCSSPCAPRSALAHDLQHDAVLQAVAVVRRKAGADHPAVFLAEVAIGMLHQRPPGQARISFHHGQQVNELLVRVVHRRHIQRQFVAPFQCGHVPAPQIAMQGSLRRHSGPAG
jgi:DNA-binding transcriptional regulator LsrR (DeoR family)